MKTLKPVIPGFDFESFLWPFLGMIIVCLLFPVLKSWGEVLTLTSITISIILARIACVCYGRRRLVLADE